MIRRRELLVPIDLLFFFDSEDYETPASDEGELWWAEALSRHGSTGCFNLVAEEARALRDRGRSDVLAALARHEIGYHSNLHSAHPVHVEYLEGMGWDEGITAALEREAAGVADVRELTGQQPATYCKPGSNWAPQVLVAMTRLAIPTFCDAPFEWAPGYPLWYCGSLCLGAHTSFDRYFDLEPDRRRSTMRKDFLALLDARRGTGGAVVMYTHPCRLMTAAFPDNFTAGQNPPRSTWRPAPQRQRSQVVELMADFDDFLGWVARETDARPTTYRAVWERHYRRNLWLATDDLDEIFAGRFDILNPRETAGNWLSPAEQLGVLLWASAWKAEHGKLPNRVPVRPLLGPDRRAAPTEPGEISTATLLEATREISYWAGQNHRVPSLVRVGDHLLGPGALLRALQEALKQSSDTVPLRSGPELPTLASRDDFARLHFNKTWSILPPEFEAPGIIELAQLQTWSARP
jgi:hypothetical protein